MAPSAKAKLTHPNRLEFLPAESRSPFDDPDCPQFVATFAEFLGYGCYVTTFLSLPNHFL
jgi:hypothetical protein